MYVKQKTTTQQEKEDRAIAYAEKHGIVEYKVKGNRMIYYADYPEYLSLPRRTYKVTVRLDTMKEERQLLKKINRRGVYNKYK